MPIKQSHTPGQIRNLGTNPGAHTEEIMKGLGYSRDEIENLRKYGALVEKIASH